ncbi:ankyrin repeat domain-containing protein [Holosporaceae bacterium 'Namur']|nr:ankyrin repeat domain-containing protein [Holosporaceae bacterium 'Namur']
MKGRDNRGSVNRDNQISLEEITNRSIKELEEIRKQREVIRIVNKIWDNKQISAAERDLLITEYAKRNEINKKEISIGILKSRVRDNYIAILIESYEEIIRNCEEIRNLSSIGEQVKQEIRNALPEAVKGILSIKERRFRNDLELRDKEDREYIVRKYIKEVMGIYNRYGYILEGDSKKIDLQKVNIEGFDLSGLDLRFVVFGSNVLRGVNLSNTGISAEQLLKAKTVKGIIVEEEVLEEVHEQRFRLLAGILDNIREQIEEARVKIDYIEDLYLLAFKGHEMEGKDTVSIINQRFINLNDQRIKNLVSFAMTSQQINLLDDSNENNYVNLSYHPGLITSCSYAQLLNMLDVMLRERKYELGEDVISYVIFLKLYNLYNVIGDSRQAIEDIENILDEFKEEGRIKLEGKIVILKNLRKESLRDEEEVKGRNDIKSIEKHLKHLNDEADIALGAGSTERLDTALNIAKESNQEVDLREIDLERVNFSRIDFSELDIRLIMTPAQENKYLSVEQRQQRYRVLFERAAVGDIEGVEEALSRGLNINTSGEYNKAALFYACESGRYEVVRWLIERGADAKVLSQGGRTLLMSICAAELSSDQEIRNGRLELIAYLIGQGADVNARDREGMTALMHACVSGQLEIAGKLIENGAEVNVANEMGRTALMVAGYYGWLNIVKLLIEKGANINAKTEAGWKIIEGLLHGEQPENIKQIVEYLMSKGAELNVHSAIKLGDIRKIEGLSSEELQVVSQDMRGGAVHTAVREGRVDILELLRKKGVDLRQVDIYGNNGLHIACEEGKSDIVGYLVREGFDVNFAVGNRTPIQIAVEKGHLQIAHMLRKAGAKLDLGSMVALRDINTISQILGANKVPDEIKAELIYLCCKYNWAELAEELIEKHKSDINAGIKGTRGIEIACELGNAEIVELFMKYKDSKGLDLNDNRSEPLLFKAITKNQERIIDILLANGADPNIVHGWLKENALFYAIRMIDRNKVDICGVARKLIESGADLGHKDSRGNAVLHYAAIEGNEELAEIILQGFKNIKDKEGKTAAQIAKEKGYNLKALEEEEERINEEGRIIPLEDMEGFVEAVKPGKKDKGKEKEDGKDTKEQDKKEELLAANASGDDRNLLADGHDRYWYSVSDGFRLLMHIRKAKLSYDNTIPVNEGEEYSAYRENREGVFIADPYHILNFRENFEDDIRRLSGQINGIAGWSNTTKVMLIPIIDGIHWRAIRITMHEDDRISILWDDPYGKNGFSEEMKSSIKQAIREVICTLCEGIEIEVEEVEEVEKVIDQQGKGLNGYDCGPIIFSNISDYIDITKSNQEFTKTSKHAYTIGEFSEQLHNQDIRILRRNDTRRYAEMAGIDLGDVEKRKVKIEEKNAQLLKDKIGITKQELLSGKQLEAISNLAPLYISMVFDIVENNRSWKGDKGDKAYSIEELTKAYNQVMIYKQWVEEVCINIPISENIDMPVSTSANTNWQRGQRPESTRDIKSSSSSASSAKKDKDNCVVSAVYSASYDNPLLNDEKIEELMKIANDNYGTKGIDKLIEVGSDTNSYRKFQKLREILGDDKAAKLYLQQVLGKEQSVVNGSIERINLERVVVPISNLEGNNQNLSFREKVRVEQENNIEQRAIGRSS